MKVEYFAFFVFSQMTHKTSAQDYKHFVAFTNDSTKPKQIITLRNFDDDMISKQHFLHCYEKQAS